MRLLLAWLPALAIAILIWSLSSVSGLAVASGTWDTVTRKAAHLVAYATLAIAVLRGLRAHGLHGGRALIGAFALVLLYAVSDEVHQETVPGRNGRPLDVGIDAAGAVAALALARRSARLRRLVTA